MAILLLVDLHTNPATFNKSMAFLNATIEGELKDRDSSGAGSKGVSPRIT